MKTTFFTAILAVVVTSASASTNPIKKTINVKESAISWTGKKVLGQHNGTLELKSGTLEMDGDQLVGGTFTVDMTSLTVTDLESGKGKEKLEGHLKSDDFFGIEAHPTATFVITDAVPSGSGYSVVGDLTIKGITQSIKIMMNVTSSTASTTFEVDRTKYNVRYGSSSFFDNLKDNAIDDNFELAVTLTF